MILVDTNVVLDVLQRDPVWAGWSIDRLAQARTEGPVVVNAIIVAELSRDYPTVEPLRVDILSLHLAVEPIDDRAAFLAGKQFVLARSRRGAAGPARPLPDFFIGAHAVTLACPLLTRDPRLYRRYFPDLPLITPETHPHG